jgi:hypothetical protein
LKTSIFYNNTTRFRRFLSKSSGCSGWFEFSD